jgi:hypothetical protein
MTKSEWREQQRKLPFEEKLRILEDLRRRDLEIRKSSLAQAAPGPSSRQPQKTARPA